MEYRLKKGRRRCRFTWTVYISPNRLNALLICISLIPEYIASLGERPFLGQSPLVGISYIFRHHHLQAVRHQASTVPLTTVTILQSTLFDILSLHCGVTIQAAIDS